MTESVRTTAERLGELVECECSGEFARWDGGTMTPGDCPWCEDTVRRLPTEAEVRRELAAEGWCRVELHCRAGLYQAVSVVAGRSLLGARAEDVAVTAFGPDASLRALLWVLRLGRGVILAEQGGGG